MGVGALGARWWERGIVGGIPDRGYGCRQGDGVLVRGRVPDKGWGSSHGVDSRQAMGYQTQMGFHIWDDGVPERELWDTRQGWVNNINESPKWNSSLLDFFSLDRDKYNFCLMIKI